MSPGSESSGEARVRAVLACGAFVLAAGLAALLAVGLGSDAFLAPPERRKLLWILAASGLGLGAAVVVWRRAIAERLVPILAGGVVLGVCLSILLLGDAYMSYRKLLQRRPGEQSQHFHQLDERIGWVPIPGAEVRHFLPDNFDVTYRIDDASLRRMRHPADPDRRLWFFGDSFSFGIGVDDDDTYAQVIADRYLDERVRVINAAIAGQGVIQMYGRLQSVRERVQPGDVVVFAPASKDLERNLNEFFFVSHFLFRDWNSAFLRFPLFEDGELRTVSYDTPWNRLRAIAYNGPLSKKLFRFFHKAITGSTTRSINEGHAVFDAARRLAEERGAGFQLTFLPRARELMRGAYDVDVSSFDYADLRRFFPEERAAQQRMRFPRDSHWTAEAHRIGAGALVAVLVERGLLRPEELRAGVSLPEPRALELVEARPGDAR